MIKKFIKFQIIEPLVDASLGEPIDKKSIVGSLLEKKEKLLGPLTKKIGDKITDLQDEAERELGIERL